MKRKIIFLCVLIAALSGFLHARGAGENGNSPLVVYGIKGPSSVGIIRLFEEPPKIGGFDVSAEALANQDLMAVRFISGEAKVGILPPNMAAKIASSGRDIRAAAIIGQGMLSLLSSDPNVRSIEDLAGKTIEAAGQGATPDYVLRKILSSHSLSPGRDLTLGYSLSPPEITQSLIAGKVSTALLPEPFATMARQGRGDLRSVADIEDEWIKSGGGGNFPMTLFVVDGDFASAHPRALGELLTAVKDSIEWVKANPGEAGTLAEKHGLGLKAAVVRAAVPNSGYVFIPAQEGRASLEALFTVFLENAPASIGGALPGDNFYHK